MRKLILSALIGCMFFGGAIMAQNRQGPPAAVGLDVVSHPLAPGVKRAKVNGQVWIDFSLPGSAVTGDVVYGADDLLRLELSWLDLLNGTVWHSNIDLRAAELPTFGGKGEHASIYVQLGPGADVTITSSSHAEMALIGSRNADALAAAPREEIIIAQACAKPLPADDPVASILRNGFSDLERERAKAARERALSRGVTMTPRCE